MSTFRVVAIVQYEPVAHAHDAVGPLPHLQGVGYQHERLSVGAVELDHHVDDLTRGLAIQVAGRLVGPHDCRLVHQGPGDGDPLTLAS